MKPRPAGKSGMLKTDAPSERRTTSIACDVPCLLKEAQAPSGEISGKMLKPGARSFAFVPSGRIVQIPRFASLKET